MVARRLITCKHANKGLRSGPGCSSTAELARLSRSAPLSGTLLLALSESRKLKRETPLQLQLTSSLPRTPRSRQNQDAHGGSAGMAAPTPGDGYFDAARIVSASEAGIVLET